LYKEMENYDIAIITHGWKRRLKIEQVHRM
jgi:hypothetical protein